MNNTALLPQLDALFNNAAIGILTVNNTGDIVLANNFLLKQFGYQEEELIGKKIETLIPKRYEHRHIKHRSNIDNIQNRPMGLGLDLYGMKKDGSEFPVEISLSGYSINNASYTIAFVSDITIRKRSEEALLTLNVQLEEMVNERTTSLRTTVEKLEIKIREAEEKDMMLRESLEKQKELNELKSKFVSLASHEFRTPLSTILSSAYLVAKYPNSEDQPKREKHIDRIASSVNMLTDILNDFLSVGKIEEGKIQVRVSEFDLHDLIKNMVAEMNTILKKGQTISYVHTGDTIIWLDPSLLKHIIMNLLSNAIKFSPEDTGISVTSLCEAKSVTISVRDAGIGISKEDQEHLFERFFRGNNVSNIQGTGLGLHIVAKYVELMNGTIRLVSDLNTGTEFIINFNR